MNTGIKYFVVFYFIFTVNTVIAQNTEAVGQQVGNKIGQASSFYLTANDLSPVTGHTVFELMSSGSANIPVWAFEGNTNEQSVAGILPGFSEDYAGVKVEIVVTTTDKETSSEDEDVYRVYLSHMAENESFTSRFVRGTPVRTALPSSPYFSRTIVLESYYDVESNVPLVIRVQREPADPADSFAHSTGLAMIKVTPLVAPASPHVVQDVSGYNSWPMLQAINDKLVCVYSRGTAHSISEDSRIVYARTSNDNGKTWTKETVVADTPEYGEVAIGKGLDSNGAMLLWVRRIGKDWNHDLYRSTDGMTFKRVATPKLDPMPMQITDVFTVPGVGLMALWFAGNYKDEPVNSWGTLTSGDNGTSWEQNVVESGLTKANWPTEQSAVYLGNGKILAVARTELSDSTTRTSQFQIVSTDYGKTWKRMPTNICDVAASTPSLILDEKTGMLSNYYYQRGRGILLRRIVNPDSIFNNSLKWSDSEAVAIGSKIAWDSGNVNATSINGTHFLAFYSGKMPNTAILMSEIPAPMGAK